MPLKKNANWRGDPDKIVARQHRAGTQTPLDALRKGLTIKD